MEVDPFWGEGGGLLIELQIEVQDVRWRRKILNGQILDYAFAKLKTRCKTLPVT